MHKKASVIEIQAILKNLVSHGEWTQDLIIIEEYAIVSWLVNDRLELTCK